MYFETIENGYTIAITTVYGQTRIAKERYDTILSMFHVKPEAKDGYDYMLRADTLEWELVESPPLPNPEPTEDEALTRYANELTGAEDETLTEATETLIKHFKED